MTGISGFKIGQAFTIEEGTLPKKYNDKVGFIIKSLSHVIGSDNKWKTDVNGIMTILSEAKIVGRDDFDLNNFISESLTITEVPAPEKPILNWIRSEGNIFIDGFDKAGTPTERKSLFFYGSKHEKKIIMKQKKRPKRINAPAFLLAIFYSLINS